MISTAIQENIWQKFFTDPNIRFPAKPMLIREIGVYHAPNGLGIQFRGGPKKLVIRGKGTDQLFTALRTVMDGNNTLEAIFNILQTDYDGNDIASILKILHAHSLLTDAEADERSPLTSNNNLQLDYYNRIKGYTNFQADGQAIGRAIKEAKILLIGSNNLIPPLLTNLELTGFNNVGLLYQQEASTQPYQNYFNQAFLSETAVTSWQQEEILNQLHLKIDDYQYTIIAFEHPNRHFLTAINDFLINKNKTSIFFNLVENTFEIGPLVIPRTTACFTCATLRKNSYNEDALFENIYHDGLAARQQLSDTSIKGIDLLSTHIAAGLFVAELTKVVANHSPSQLHNALIAYDVLNNKLTNATVLPVAGCPSCAR